MGNKALENAEALIAQYEAEESEVNIPVAPQAGEVLGSASPQPQPTPVAQPVQPIVIPQAPVQAPVNYEALIQQQQTQIEKLLASQKILQGKYNAETPRLMRENAQLEKEVQLLRQQTQVPQATQVVKPVVPPTSKLFDSEKVDELGPEYADAIQTAYETSQEQMQASLAQQDVVYQQKLQELNDKLFQQEWASYNKSVQMSVPNFQQLMNPFGDNNLDGEFTAFLEERFMLKGFLQHDYDMNVEAVVGLCNMYNDYKKQAVQQLVNPTAQQPLANPKAQTIAPPTVQTQVQPVSPEVGTVYKLSDYTKMSMKLTHHDIQPAEWDAFASKFENASKKGLVDMSK